ncbi:nitric oxide reductase subunit NorC [Cocleimonas flava]|uniref:Nitric oxide reductase NorC subunit apoprotein n=1 Tax=Cocleimonas flava TaxID=634765 RepID=A0A4R1F705_9GAMM|nr:MULTISPECIES: cytochrome c [Cocleimonas]MEB8430640.1 cytochrome c [Cocleimonas sp. KMM 6892]MEC4716909.1 cytochrome c [Cocleimonas sp. KMM 6895]MEC4743921.1 cytochrome c [Cocleimonas sp. KMM 6896]TCJ88339.1 nitric oxide reductase NorC subunit apoprotein [Cocleimonas flava]
MRETFTKGMARNIYYGGGVFFFLVLIGLTVDTVRGLPKTDNSQNLTEEVAAGKRLWEINNCIGCHTLLGEGAYFAPELGNVYTRFGESTDAIKGFIMSRPKDGIPGRRSMPQFNFTPDELEEIAQFLKYVDGIKVARDWPPNKEG